MKSPHQLNRRKFITRSTSVAAGAACLEWHTGIRSALPNNSYRMDKPVAALIKDLKSRGLLDETLVVIAREQRSDGRRENAASAHCRRTTPHEPPSMKGRRGPGSTVV